MPAPGSTATRVWANLPVKDVARTRTFYTSLGFRPAVGYDNGDQLASFLFGDEQFMVHFFPENAFATAARTPAADPRRGSEVLFTLSAQSRPEVDEWVDSVREAGGTVFAQPEEVGTMYGCGFADPDGHRWNVLYREPGSVVVG